VVRRLIDITHLANTWCRKSLSTNELTQWHEQSTRVTFWLSTGEGTGPLTNHQEMTTNNHQLMSILLRYSKPSRWRQPPRVIRNPQLQWSSSVTRNNHSSNCTRNHSQSHYDDESIMEMSGRCLLRLTRMSSMSKCQEKWAQAGQELFIEPQTNRVVIPLHWACCAKPAKSYL
jgi:hypothetical protein